MGLNTFNHLLRKIEKSFKLDGKLILNAQMHTNTKRIN